jgi:hypothetical protein
VCYGAFRAPAGGEHFAMNHIYVFLIRNHIWIYILCSLGLLWYMSNLLRARVLLRRAMFGLEKEKGLRLQNTAVTFLTVLALIVGLVAYVNMQIAPTLPAELLKPPTPTPNIFATPLVSPTPLGSPQPPAPTATPPIVATVTLRSSDQVPAPVADGGPTNTPPAERTATGDPGTAPPRPSLPPAAGCSPEINISSPTHGAAISGSTAFIGSATAAGFAFYKLEANGPETGGIWASIIGGTIERPVEDGFLGTANMGAWSAGVYSFRLTVVDLTSNEVGQCTVQLNVENSQE